MQGQTSNGSKPISGNCISSFLSFFFNRTLSLTYSQSQQPSSDERSRQVHTLLSKLCVSKCFRKICNFAQAIPYAPSAFRTVHSALQTVWQQMPYLNGISLRTLLRGPRNIIGHSLWSDWRSGSNERSSSLLLKTSLHLRDQQRLETIRLARTSSRMA